VQVSLSVPAFVAREATQMRHALSARLQRLLKQLPLDATYELDGSLQVPSSSFHFHVKLSIPAWLARRPLYGFAPFHVTTSAGCVPFVVADSTGHTAQQFDDFPPATLLGFTMQKVSPRFRPDKS